MTYVSYKLADTSRSVTALAKNVVSRKRETAFLFINTTKQVSVQMVSLTGQVSRSGVKGDSLSQQQVNRSLHILHHMMWLDQF